MDWTNFWTNFWTILKGEEHIISTEGGVGGSVLLPRKGRETDYHYAGRSGRWL